VVERLPTILNIHYAIIVATALVFRDVLSESTAVVTKDADSCHQYRVLGAAVPERVCGDHTERLSDASGGDEDWIKQRHRPHPPISTYPVAVSHRKKGFGV